MTLGSQLHAPGVYLETVLPRPEPAFETGVPAFLGRLSDAGRQLAPFSGGAAVVPLDAVGWSALEARLGTAWAERALGFAVRGFFENGGRRCYLAPLGPQGLTESLLELLDAVEDFDLVCAPETATDDVETQVWLVDFFGRRPRCLVLLDAPSGRPGDTAPDARLRRANAALYAPWVKVRDACPACGGKGRKNEDPCVVCWGSGQGFVPPSGHVAGVYSRTDQRVGVHKAPANEVLEGVLDVQANLEPAALADVYQRQGINCLRALPGRGIRVWGARTLAAPADAGFAFINARRVYTTVARWLERTMAGFVFEPNDLALWARLGRDVGAFLEGLFRRGALAGATAAEAFYVKCDAETNPPAVRDSGQVVAEVGLALARPAEFIVVRLVSGPSGTSVSSAPGAP